MGVSAALRPVRRSRSAASYQEAQATAAAKAQELLLACHHAGAPESLALAAGDAGGGDEPDLAGRERSLVAAPPSYEVPQQLVPGGGLARPQPRHQLPPVPGTRYQGTGTGCRVPPCPPSEGVPAAAHLAPAGDIPELSIIPGWG